jgi:hypothetical protein
MVAQPMARMKVISEVAARVDIRFGGGVTATSTSRATGAPAGRDGRP